MALSLFLLAFRHRKIYSDPTLLPTAKVGFLRLNCLKQNLARAISERGGRASRPRRLEAMSTTCSSKRRWVSQCSSSRSIQFRIPRSRLSELSQEVEPFLGSRAVPSSSPQRYTDTPAAVTTPFAADAICPISFVEMAIARTITEDAILTALSMS
jgi:hypothetical protein